MKKLASLTAFWLLLVSLGAWGCPSFAQDDSSVLNRGWWVIAASVPTDDDPMMKRRSAILLRAKQCGFDLYNDASGKFAGFTKGYQVYVLGAYTTKAKALAVRDALVACLPGGYVKFGTYAGD